MSAWSAEDEEAIGRLLIDLVEEWTDKKLPHAPKVLRLCELSKRQAEEIIRLRVKLAKATMELEEFRQGQQILHLSSSGGVQCATKSEVNPQSRNTALTLPLGQKEIVNAGSIPKSGDCSKKEECGRCVNISSQHGGILGQE